ncbi:unnamed protein product [Symbiodinium sp. CCMP2592]|nr:unnamed protein product [Symbiodinium sp. CCMP2592]
MSIPLMLLGNADCEDIEIISSAGEDDSPTGLVEESVGSYSRAVVMTGGLPNEPPFVYHGIYFAGARGLLPVEVDLKLEFLEQGIYLVRGVEVSQLPYPSDHAAEMLAFSMVSHGQVRWDQMLRLVKLLPCDANLRWAQSECHAEAPHRFTSGAWNRGPMTGLTITARGFPWATAVLASVVATWDEALNFSTCTLSLNVCAKPHRDRYNHGESRNLAMPMSRFFGGELYVEAEAGRTRLSEDGPWGHVLELSSPVSFTPKALHASMPWHGTRLLLLAFHIGQVRNLSERSRAGLQKLGFRLGFLE